MAAPQHPPGFTPHVWDQLEQTSHQLAQQSRGNHRGRGHSRGFPNSRHPHQQQHQYVAQNEPAFFHNQQVAPHATSDEAFPPLGTVRPPTASNVSLQPQYQPPPYSQSLHGSQHRTPREYQDHARGGHRGRAAHFGTQQHFHPAAQNPDQPQYHSYGRPPPRRRNLFDPNGGAGYGTVEQQRSMRHLIMKQSDYLNSVGRKAHAAHRLSREESLAKESFRQELEKVARDALEAKYPDLDIGNVRLRCYGSLANGFALAGCDMDLLLSLPSWSKEEPLAVAAGGQMSPQQDYGLDDEDEELAFNMEVRRVLEKAYLDSGYGARLLTNTRVPILRICQSPNPELLENLRESRAAWEKSSFETPAADANPLPADATETPTEVDAIENALADLKVASDVPKASALRGNAGLEFTKDSGIQCDINFTNFVALHNSALLKLYRDFDQRVADIGVFVKIWAKMRDINTPYRGTLSSYGYILMVLHYLMNIANPPVIPNLQHLAKIEDEWNPGRKIELFEGFDVRFVQDPNVIEGLRREMSANKNHESAGQLLRGFFRYYGTREGFHWTRDVISIRSKGGILSKQEKGWTEAKWTQKGDSNVRLRYLLAIEDPFEIDHNIARTVGHHGLVAIRDEFRRAWSILERIGAGEAVSIDEFLEPVTDRADTLRKDLEFHRQKQKQMKQALEAKQKVLLDQAKTLGAEDPDGHTVGTLGTSEYANMRSGSSMLSQRRSLSSKLTSATSTQDKNKTQPLKSWRHRKVRAESDNEEDSVGGNQDGSEMQASAEKSQATMHDTTIAIGSEQDTTRVAQGLCTPGDVLLANGLDHWGNPVAWDIDTQEGRWLHWRDNKIRQGTYRAFSDPSMRELNEQCPFNPDRPNPYIDKPYKDNLEQMQMQRPPWPANNSHVSTPSNRIGRGTADSVRVLQTSESSESGSGRAAATRLVPETQPKVPQKESVGEVIAWDVTTFGGRFLSYRDRRTRQGKWENHQRSKFTELDRGFPYDPEMTHEELALKNELLRTYYMYTPYRRKVSPDMSPAQVAKQPSGPTNDAQRLDLNMAPSATTGSQDHAHQGVVSTARPQLDLTNDQPSTLRQHEIPDGQVSAASASQVHDSQARLPAAPVLVESFKPDKEFVRQQRLAFFAKEPSASESDTGTNSRYYQQNVGNESEDMGKDLTHQPPHSHEPALQRPIQELPETTSTLFNEPSLVQDEGEEGESLPLESGSPEDSPNFDHQAAMSLASLKVPAAIYPGLDPSQRPKDEGPQIIPIPEQFGFQLDPRQLRDLSIIAQGGNGCVRAGEEFGIEAEYEGGGGGMSGWRTSTSSQDAGLSAGDAVSHESGSDDREGLLDELPRGLD